MLLHGHILPHHKESHEIYSALRETEGDPRKIQELLASQTRYRALMTLCPEIYLIEHNLLEKLPFAVEKDPELLKKSGWLVSFSRAL
jgi:hypothetical protein